MSRAIGMVAVLLALSPVPALADVTAHYRLGKDVLTVEVDDSGDYRAELSGKVAMVRHSGSEYVLITLGDKVVATERDVFFPLLKSKLGEGEPAPGQRPSPRAVMTVLQDGAAQIAGRKGEWWRIGRNDADKGLRLAVSADPVLAPVGTVLHHVLSLMLDSLAPILGSDIGLRDKVLGITGRGTLIAIAGVPTQVMLESVSTGEIDPGRFAKPATLLDAGAIDAALSAPTPQADATDVPPAH